MSTFGTVLFKEGKFFVEVGGRQELLPVAEKDIPQVKALVDKKVEVVFSEPFIAGLIFAQEKPFPKIVNILCNVPRPDIRTLFIEDSVRIDHARRMLEGNLLSKEVFEKIAAPNVIAKKASV